MKVKIPVTIGEIQISSKGLDRINILTKIILHLINSEINTNRLKDIINLPERLILENIEKLQKDGIIFGDYFGNYKLTDVGEKNFKFLSEVEELNKKKIRVAADNYTKHIFKLEEIYDVYADEKELVQDDMVQEIKGNRYIKQYLSNLNPSNSKEIVLTMLSDLDEQDKEGIDVEIKIMKEKVGYIMGEMKENIVKRSEKSKFGSEVIVKREVFKNIIVPEFKSLKKMDRKSLEALEVLGEKNFNLLSEEGLDIAEKIKLSKEKFTYYYDPKNKKISTEKIKSTADERDIKTNAVLEDSNQEENINIRDIREINLIEEKYGSDVELRVKVEKEFVYEKFAIEDVIDIYEEAVKNV